MRRIVEIVRQEGACNDVPTADPDRMVRAGKKRVVARRVAVRPDDGVGDPGLSEPPPESAHLLGPTAVRPGQMVRGMESKK